MLTTDCSSPHFLCKFHSVQNIKPNFTSDTSAHALCYISFKHTTIFITQFILMFPPSNPECSNQTSLHK